MNAISSRGGGMTMRLTSSRDMLRVYAKEQARTKDQKFLASGLFVVQQFLEHIHHRAFAPREAWPISFTARWFAVDAEGIGKFFEWKPRRHEMRWDAGGAFLASRHNYSAPPGYDWRLSLQHNPVKGSLESVIGQILSHYRYMTSDNGSELWSDKKLDRAIVRLESRSTLPIMPKKIIKVLAADGEASAIADIHGEYADIDEGRYRLTDLNLLLSPLTMIPWETAPYWADYFGITTDDHGGVQGAFFEDQPFWGMEYGWQAQTDSLIHKIEPSDIGFFHEKRESIMFIPLFQSLIERPARHNSLIDCAVDVDTRLLEVSAKAKVGDPGIKRAHEIEFLLNHLLKQEEKELGNITISVQSRQPSADTVRAEDPD